MRSHPNLHGLLAEFPDSESLRDASRAIYDDGYRRIDAYSPFPVEGLADAIGFRSTRLAWWTFIGGVTGAVGGLLLEYYTSAVSYPVNVGGRPLASWPAFGPVAFELCILTAAFFALFGMLGRNGLPMPYHPTFNVAAFEKASTEGFFLVIESEDPQFDRERTEARLKELGAQEVYEVPD